MRFLLAVYRSRPYNFPLNRVQPGAMAALVVLLGLLVRIWHLDYDQGMNSHPDERSNGFYAVDIAWPSPITETLISAESPLNPFWNDRDHTKKRFTYGHFPLYAGVVLASWGSKVGPVLEALGLPDTWVAHLAQSRTDPGRGLLMARLAIALLDTATGALVYAIASKIYGWRTGLLAAFLYAVAMLPVKDSHFFAFDPAAATFVTLTVLGSLLLLQAEPRWYAPVLAGVGMGLAVASKFSALPVTIVPVLALCLRFRPGAAAGPRRARALFPAFASLAGPATAVYGIGCTTFAVASPFTLLDAAWFWDHAVVPQGNMVRGVYDWAFTRQYRGTWPYVYFIRQQVQWGLWYPLGLSAVVGTLWTVLRLLGRFGFGSRNFFPPVLPGEMLLLAWIGPYFGITGAFLAKFNRYMIPLLPMVVIFGAAWLGWICGWWGSAKSKLPPLLRRVRCARDRLGAVSGMVLVVGVVGGSSLWLSSYVHGIWEKEHTWLTASKWIYAHVPDGATILWEVWDDPLPVDAGRISASGFPGSDKIFRRIEWGPFEEDTRSKLDLLKERLVAADYVIYSSNRIYAAVRRLPARYPMTIAYYDAMFDGSLGFEVAHRTSGRLRVLGFEFDETGADESWTLYDHPPVVVLRKHRHVSAAEIEARLAPRLEEARIGYVTPGSFLNPIVDGVGAGLERIGDWGDSREPGSRTLQTEAGADPMHIVPAHRDARGADVISRWDDFRFNDIASRNALLAVLTWWAALFLIGLAAWPLCFRVFAELPDRGYALSRLCGWLALAVPLWWLAHGAGPVFTVAGVWGAFAVLAAAGLAAAFLQRHEIRSFLRSEFAQLLCLETGFTLAFGGGVLLRLANPDLWQPWFGGEKFMEMAIWNGILRSPTLPPLDAHFAGETLNYYYFGHFLLAVLTKFTGIWTEVAFNLAVPTVLGLTFLLAWTGVLYYHLRPRRHASPGQTGGAALHRDWTRGMVKALWAPFLLLGIGNPQSGLLAAERLRAALASERAPRPRPRLLDWDFGDVPGALQTWYTDLVGMHYWWDVSRVVPGTINEFPAWTFVFGDLHAHLLGVPLTLLLFCLTVAAIGYPRSGTKALVFLLLAGGVCGLVSATNIWDLPIAGSLVAIAALLVSRRWFPARGLGIPVAVAVSTGCAGLAAVVSMPFWRHFELVAGRGLGWVSQGDEPLVWLRVWALFYFLIVCWLLMEATGSSGMHAKSETGVGRSRLMPIGIGALLIGLAAAYRHTTFGMIAVPLGLAWVALCRKWRCGRDRAIVCWCLLVLGVWAGTQVIVVKDFLFDSAYYRMNTVFKFFFQGWILASLVCAVLLPTLWQELRTWYSRSTFRVTAAAGAVLLLLSLGFPLLGMPARLETRFPDSNPAWGTLDGLAFMDGGSFVTPSGHIVDLGYDREAIAWIHANVAANVTILESAQVDYYRSGGTRIASLTGLPGLLGMHEQEQRPGGVVAAREALMHRLWNTPDEDELLHALRDNGIGLIYVGQLEQIEHAAGAELYRAMAAAGRLDILFANEKSMLLALPETLPPA